MIRLEQTNVFNFEGAIRGMRNPLNSWNKSDSHWNTPEFPDQYIIGNEDMKLAKRLIRSGSDHRKFVRQIFVSVDITAPLYWWKEFDTYKVGTVANSCSTMHKIHDKEFTMDDFSHEHLIRFENVKGTQHSSTEYLSLVIFHLNYCRDRYLETKDKKYWWQMIQLLPTSYNQKRTITLNYENLYGMYQARKNHKLDEWHVLCDWMKTLPYFEEMFLSDGE